MKKLLSAVIHGIKTAETICSTFILGFMVTIIAIQVVMRYFFNSPLIWPEELASFLLIYLSFFSASIIYKEKGHIAIDYFVQFLSNRSKIIVRLLVYIFISILLIAVFRTSFLLIKVQFSHTTAAALTFPRSFYTLPVPIAFFSMLLTTVHFMLEEINNLSKDIST